MWLGTSWTPGEARAISVPRFLVSVSPRPPPRRLAPPRRHTQARGSLSRLYCTRGFNLAPPPPISTHSLTPVHPREIR
ncbi:hypothetical protein E2C01_028579 [Portunus trituberculatus]|uniref:Uncharacterized protein n=1 Tax=Portunus trituberculatus TaxID=210409 RepID=A0A5B7EQD0_PORTR|nr:hypothetical protein [Portunus trituberculatus]